MKDIVLVFCIGTGVAGAGMYQGVEFQRSASAQVVTEPEGTRVTRHETPQLLPDITTWPSVLAP